MHTEDEGEAACVAEIKARKILPTVLLDQYLDLTISPDDFSDEINDFLSVYFGGYYPDDFRALFGKGTYDVPNTWEVYDQVAAALDGRLAQWQTMHKFSRGLPGAEAKSRTGLGRLFGR